MASKDRKVIKAYGRLSFPQLDKPRAFGTNKVEKYQATNLIDSSSPEGAATKAEIKAEAVRLAKEKWGDSVEMKKLTLCFGDGDKKAVDSEGEENKTYAAYKGLFYISAASERRPLIANRAGELIEAGNAQFPYAGSFGNLKTSLYAWEFRDGNLLKRGISADLRSYQFVKDGESFGRAPIDPDEEFEAYGDEAAPTAKTGTDDDF